MGELSPWHWAIVILVLVLLFGARRLPDAARSLGRSARILKSELRAGEQESAQAASPPPADPETTTVSDPESTITTSQNSPRQN